MNLQPVLSDVNQRFLQRALILASALALNTLWATSAAAFCQTTSCDPDDPAQGSCPKDNNGCLTSGLPLAWPDLCVTFAVEQHGSKKRNIKFNEAELAVERAFQAWLGADCGSGRHPSIGVVPLGVSYCDKVEYNQPRKEAEDLPRAPNSNTVMFRDDSWPHVGDDSTLALTTVTFSKETGEILDADIEVNSFAIDLTTGDTNIKNDLQSILTHEVGHFLGMAHSRTKGATMNPEYRVNLQDTSFRTLSQDDQRGICAIYKPQADDITDCTGEGPRYGFSRYCAEPGEADAACLCSFDRGRPSQPTLLLSTLTALALAGSLGLRRRRGRNGG